VPALLEALRVPYTGADAFTLTICIDKAIIKRLWHDAGLPTPPFRLVQDMAGLAGAASELGGFPLFVKPAREGSSKGISPRSVVQSDAALADQAALLLRSYQPLLVEPYLSGREFSVGVLGSGQSAESLGAVEILHGATPLVDVLDKKAWAPQTFQPVGDAGLRGRLCALGLQAYRALDCRAIARVDMRMDRAGNLQLLEINPNPGLHPKRSAMPALARLAGLSYADLISRLISQALACSETQL
jgi:D-alanine-D-alanine ligase